MKLQFLVLLVAVVFFSLTVRVFAQDSDSDGFSDKAEKEIYGTDPKDSKSSPANVPDNIKSVNFGKLGFDCRTYFYKNIFEIKASGSDVWVNTDECRFVYQEVSGNFTLVAKLDSVETADQWTKAGLMIRNKIVPYSENVFLCMTNNKGYYFQARKESTAITVSVGSTLNSQTGPYWMKLERIGNTLNSYYSRDAEHWDSVGSTEIKLNEKVYAGLALTSHKKGVLATAKFSGFAIKKQQ